VASRSLAAASQKNHLCGITCFEVIYASALRLLDSLSPAAANAWPLLLMILFAKYIFARGEGEVTVGGVGIYGNDVYAVAAHNSCICTRQLMDCSKKSTPTYVSSIKSNQFSTDS
jgi:hypothetical protein